jgi:hypothetical protein
MLRVVGARGLTEQQPGYRLLPALRIQLLLAAAGLKRQLAQDHKRLLV